MSDVGCGTGYSVSFFDRLDRVLCHVPSKYEISGQWTRIMDETSYAEVTVSGACCECRPVAWAHEMAIFRDGDTNPTWRGPIQTVEDRGTELFITAADKSMYWRRRQTTRVHDFLEVPIDLAELFNRLIEDANTYVWTGLDSAPATPTGIEIFRYIEKNVNIARFIDEIGQGGLDWTVVGSLVYAGGLRNSPPAATPLNTRTHWEEQPVVYWDGARRVTRVIARGADGIMVIYPNTDEPIPDPVYGVLEEELDYPDVTDPTELFLLAYSYYMENKGDQPSIVTGDTALSNRFPYEVKTLVPGRLFYVMVEQDCATYPLVLQLYAVHGEFENGQEVGVRIDLQPPSIEEPPPDDEIEDSVTVTDEPEGVIA